MSSENKLSMKDLKTADPRWCAGCGDYMILVGLRKLMVKHQIDPAKTVNVSGIGCSGRMPHYMNTYGFHTIHGRAIPVALGVRLAQPDTQVFVHSGDGDSLSIGGNHLLHGLAKNINCVYVLYDNQIYGLTKNQTSPTTQKGQSTMTQPEGTWTEPINPISFALGAGASFVASTMEWNSAHMLQTLDLALAHPGFSFVHIAQRCPKYNPNAWDTKATVQCLVDSKLETYDEKTNPKLADIVEHDSSDLTAAYAHAKEVPNCFGLFYKEERPCYDENLLSQRPKELADRHQLLDRYQLKNS